MLTEQEELANRTRTFLESWGLKSKYVAEVCSIHEKTFSKFVNHRIALSRPQITRLTGYISEYEEKMNSIAPKIIP